MIQHELIHTSPLQTQFVVSATLCNFDLTDRSETFQQTTVLLLGYFRRLFRIVASHVLRSFVPEQGRQVQEQQRDRRVGVEPIRNSCRASAGCRATVLSVVSAEQSQVVGSSRVWAATH